MNNENENPPSSKPRPSLLRNWVSLTGVVVMVSSVFAFLLLFLVDSLAHFARGGAPFGTAGGARNTTLAVVATNATLDRTGLEALAHAAGDALARRIVPYGTLFDGDVVFAVSTAAAAPATPLQAEALAALAVPIAVERAVRLARGLRDIPGLADSGGR